MRPLGDYGIKKGFLWHHVTLTAFMKVNGIKRLLHLQLSKPADERRGLETVPHGCVKGGEKKWHGRLQVAGRPAQKRRRPDGVRTHDSQTELQGLDDEAWLKAACLRLHKTRVHNQIKILRYISRHGRKGVQTKGTALFFYVCVLFEWWVGKIYDRSKCKILGNCGNGSVIKMLLKSTEFQEVTFLVDHYENLLWPEEANFLAGSLFTHQPPRYGLQVYNTSTYICQFVLRKFCRSKRSECYHL